jgi:hypothetical protein
MKTTLQEVFSRLKELHPRLLDIYTLEGMDFIREFHKFMEIEKQQIKDAYNQGYRDGGDEGSGKDISLFDDANLYYNETYKKP